MAETVNLLDGRPFVGATGGYESSNPQYLAYDGAAGRVYSASQGSNNVLVVNASDSTVVTTVRLDTQLAPPPGAGPIRGAYALALDSAHHRLYVSHQSDYISVIDTSNETLVASVPLGQATYGLAVDSGHGLLFAADAGLGDVDILSTVNLTMVGQVSVGSSPSDVALDPAVGALFVSVQGNRTVAELNSTTERAVRWTTVPFSPWGVAFDAGTGDVYAAGCGSVYNVSAISATNGSVLALGKTGNCGALVTPLPDIHRIAVANPIGVNFFVMNDTTLALTNTVYAGASSTVGMAYDPPDRLLYVGEQSWNRLGVFSVPSFSTAFHMPIAGSVQNVAYDPLASSLDALDYWQNQIDQLNLTTGRVTVNHPTGSQPDSIVYDPATQEVYVANSASASLGVFYASNLTAITTISLGGYPLALAYDSLNGHILFSESYSCGYSWCASVVDVNASSHTVVNSTAVAGVYNNEIAYGARHDRAYLPNGGGNTLVVVNMTAHTVLKQVGVGSVPDAVAYDPADDTVWVANQNSNNVTVVNATSDTVVANISTHVCCGTTYAAYDPGLNEMIVLASGYPNFFFYNATTNLAVANATITPLPFWGVGSNGGMDYVSAQVGLAVADNNVVSFLQPLPSGPALLSMAPKPITGSVGQPIVFNATSAGGAIPVTHSYAGLPPGCASSNVSALTCVPNGSGTYSVTGQVTDMNSSSASGTTTVTVLPRLSISPIAFDPGSKLPGGTPLLISANLTGGVGGYAFNWSGLPAGCTGITTDWVACPSPVGGNYTIGLSVEDAEGAVVRAASRNLTVYAPLSLRLTANRTALDVGENLTLRAGVAGGTFSYAFAWSGLPTPCVSMNSSSIRCAPTGAATTNVSVTVTDLGDNASLTNTLPVQVFSDPSAVPIAASLTTLETGESTNLSVRVTNGTGVFTYAWTGLPPGCPSRNASAFSCDPSRAGNFTLSVNITDSSGYQLTSSGPTLAILAGLSTPAMSVSSSAIDLGGSFTLSVNFTGGQSPYTFAWLGLPRGCSSRNQSVLSCIPNSSGAWAVEVQVTDALGLVQSSNPAELTVNPPLSLGPLSASRFVADAGQSATWAATVSGGSGVDSFLWSGLPSGCSSANTSSMTCALGSAAVGNWSVALAVSDSLGGRDAAGPVSLAVYTALGATVAVSRSDLDLGQGFEIWANQTGGSPLASETWSGLPPGCAPPAGQSASTFLCQSDSAGTYQFNVALEDAAGAAFVTGQIQVVIHPDPAVTSFSVNRSSVDVGQGVTFTLGVVLPGSGGDTVSWLGLPTGCSPPVNGSAPFSCLPQSPGRFEVSVTLTDSAGFVTQSSTATLVVDSPPVVDWTEASSEPLSLGATLRLVANVSAGSGGFAFSWSGLPPGCLAPRVTPATLTCVPAVLGNYSVALRVTDSNGGVGQSPPVNVTIVPASSPPPSQPSAPSSQSTPVYLLVGVIVAGVVGLALALIRSRRRRDANAPLDEAPAPAQSSEAERPQDPDSSDAEES